MQINGNKIDQHTGLVWFDHGNNVGALMESDEYIPFVLLSHARYMCTWFDTQINGWFEYQPNVHNYFLNNSSLSTFPNTMDRRIPRI